MKRTFLCLALLVGAACTKSAKGSTGGTPATTADFKGVNWADIHDNYSDTVVVPSGLLTSDSYDTVRAKAGVILSAFQQAGANTVRLPVNPYTVAGPWWNAYKGAIDEAVARGFRVILGYWEGTSAKDGLVDNLTQFWSMWQALTTQYGTNANVYFEVFNEPFGYSVSDLESLYVQWLSNYPSVPRGRVFLDGAGYATDVNDIGADSRFDSCMLSYHSYTWFNSNYKTVSDWEQAILSVAYPSRTVLTEFGIPMTTGENYLAATPPDVSVAYLQGLTNELKLRSIGSVYWPGLRTGDSFSLFTLNGSAMTVNNASGLTKVQYGWGL
ncbi:glycoside hydrolase family 5 protein [Dinghuibacter silviterrae]|uniref:Cellulase (Glycosyl hydrolase family 5) n=1 Tax=Dinghuibacter silviterrae TaxID=1539049 RepID=A0A4R8DIX6_9BACT|nr:cellulase family glycosylhydrolase [Dinghuibacter silviterrae]TDW97274.1 cellulase (glycosyl hydrolase family 5) [Dinghuibacter silviterrae]